MKILLGIAQRHANFRCIWLNHSQCNNLLVKETKSLGGEQYISEHIHGHLDLFLFMMF